jgi:ABC-type branched-subunit amino acid transport system substrate-binding protein
VALAAATLLAACSTKAVPAGGGESSSGVKTGPGVTSSSITLGVLSVLSGAYANVGLPVLQGAQLYFSDLNKQGGVCGRTVKLDVEDDGLDVQQAVSDYTAMEPNVLGMAQLVGSAVNSALTQQVLSDQMFTFPSSNSSTLLNNPDYIIPGATYDVAFINAVEWLKGTKGLAKGETIGYVSAQGDTSGGNLGVEYAAKQLGLKLVELAATPTATDLSSQAAALKNDRAKAILVSTPPGQTLSLASAAESIGLNVPIVGDQSTFTPQELSAASGQALEQNFYVTTAIAAFSDTAAGPTTVRGEYTAKYKGQPVSQFIDYGYAGAGAYAAVLKQACADKDLSREGLIKAFRETRSADTQGVFPPLDFSQPGDPTTRESLIARPTAAAAGGLTVVQAFTASALAKSYVAPEHGQGEG